MAQHTEQNAKSVSRRAGLLSMLALLWVCLPGEAQTVNVTVQGRVYDASGAAIPDGAARPASTAGRRARPTACGAWISRRDELAPGARASPRLHRILGSPVAAGLLGLGVFTAFPGWVLWGLLMGFGLGHHPRMDAPEARLDGRRRAMVAVSVVLFVLSFSPVPLALLAG